MSINIAIDGPAGAGKSSISKRLAKELGCLYVDTGAMYRAIAYYFVSEKLPISEEAIAENCVRADVSLRYENGEQIVMLNGKNVTPYIRSKDVTALASVCSAVPRVREHLLALQRSLAAEHDVVMDGRDIGTTILPDAQVKIFLTASARVRALRRQKEMEEKGEKCSFDEILAQIIERDERDRTREASPLRQAEDAVLVDTSDMDIETVVRTLIGIVKEKTEL